MTVLNTIDKIQAPAPVVSSQSAATSGEAGIGMFADVFKNAVQNVMDAGAAKSEAQYLLATGELDNPAELMIAANKSSLATELLVQIRTRALDAYKELTNIQM